MSETVRADVCVIGAGIVGLHNALQYARRGFSVVVVDELTERSKSAYKVGESLLIFSNAFLRTIGELDKELSESFEKRGVWFSYGLEGKTSFEGNVSEWGFQHAIPERWKDAFTDKKFQRTMFGDCQIVRPEIEAVLRDRLKQFESITLIDRGLVRDLELGGSRGSDADHVVTWRSKDNSAEGTVHARWLVDCSGRARLLVKRFGHDVPLDDDFVSSSVWGQFSGCTDEFFDERWNFQFPDGDVVRRDLDTVHLWGDGYWIWLIRLTDDRISVGVSLHKTRTDLDRNLRTAFWQIIRRYPMLDWLQPENVLDFSAYRDLQYISDTYVSPERYVIVGDASSIIDAYYSQGISLSLATSWHGANIVERDLREGVLDTKYIKRVNDAVLADWRIMRSMVQSKYGRAIADSRFFILDHWIDYLVFGSATGIRWGISRWLSQTDGYTSNETPDLAKLRTRLSRRLFLSQSVVPFSSVHPARVARFVERLHERAARRAIWRMDHGVNLRATTGAMRADAPMPALWRLPFLRFRRRADLTMKAIKEPSFIDLKVGSRPPAVTKTFGVFLLVITAWALGYDVADTAVRRAIHGVRGLFGRDRRGKVYGAEEVARERTQTESQLSRTAADV
ncbi:NAD(P)/FAD-dependent oxidoreductase [Phytohabitans sp. LJ34]|uniref:NAD(P)/FAD-dependent oxidoreductase n=1 Tax=Phytohabitans sp. LJ34 TaxID=3452217 RepID=UPI003F8A9B85